MKKLSLYGLAAMLLAGTGFANAANSSVVANGTTISADSKVDSFCWEWRYP